MCVLRVRVLRVHALRIRKSVLQPSSKGCLHGRELPHEKMIRAGNELQPPGLRRRVRNRAQLGNRRILVPVTAEKEFWKFAALQVRIGVIASSGMRRQPQRGEALYIRIAATSLQS